MRFALVFGGVVALLSATLAHGQSTVFMPRGDAERGRLVFGACRTCHYPDAYMGHNYGPNLNRIFGKVAGKQEGFDHYSETFKQAQFVWTPELLYQWLGDPLGMFPETTMMSRGVPDPQARADLIAFLILASQREDPDFGSPSSADAGAQQ